MATPDRPPMEITAVVPGKCQCCNTPYGKGAQLRKEGRYWVLIDHPDVKHNWVGHRG